MTATALIGIRPSRPVSRRLGFWPAIAAPPEHRLRW
jgi:hypothetical protein